MKMNQADTISTAITVFAIAAATIFNNLRISETSRALCKRFDELSEVLRSVGGHMRSGTARLHEKLDRIADTLAAAVQNLERGKAP